MECRRSDLFRKLLAYLFFLTPKLNAPAGAKPKYRSPRAILVQDKHIMRPANPPPATCHPPRKAARRLALVLLLGTAAAAPQDIDVREVAIVSEGTRMSGQAYSLKSSAGKKLPC